MFHKMSIRPEENLDFKAVCAFEKSVKHADGFYRSFLLISLVVLGLAMGYLMILGAILGALGLILGRLGLFWGTPDSTLQSQNSICPSTRHLISHSTYGSSAACNAGRRTAR